jgi:hypothetical protein
VAVIRLRRGALLYLMPPAVVLAGIGPDASARRRRNGSGRR